MMADVLMLLTDDRIYGGPSGTSTVNCTRGFSRSRGVGVISPRVQLLVFTHS